MTKKAKVSKPQTVPEPACSVSLQVNGLTLLGKGATIDAAILNLPAFQPKTKGTITITKDGRSSKPLLFNIQKLKQLFFPGMTGQVSRIALTKRYEFFA